MKYIAAVPIVYEKIFSTFTELFWIWLIESVLNNQQDNFALLFNNSTQCDWGWWTLLRKIAKYSRVYLETGFHENKDIKVLKFARSHDINNDC